MKLRTLATWALALAGVSCNKAEPTAAPQPSATPSASAPAPVASSPPPTPPAPPSAPDTIATSGGDLKITPLNHATLLLEWKGKAIYADPAPAAKYDNLPKADVILVTDIHGDHMSPPTIASLRQAKTTVVVPPAVQPSLPPEGIVVVKNGETKQVDGISVQAIPMYNLTRGPSEGKLYHDKGRGNGYVLTLGATRVYLSGDTECTPEMKALKNIDVAFVCMNLPYTMPPSEAAECVAAFHPKIVYPYHYRGSNLDEFKSALSDSKGTEIRIRNWYP
jgi:L-ascorbate metabolism protein UlaG (beta-lactamase superfamily)